MSFMTDDERLIKKCNGRNGTFHYLAHDVYVGRSMELYGEWSQGEVDKVCGATKQGDCVIEVGSNMGTHTIPIAKHIGNNGKLIAFEPQRIMHQILCANIIENGLTNVWTYNCAVSNEVGTIHVLDLSLTDEHNFGGVRVGQNQGSTVDVKSIDSLGLPRVDFIKVDAEGYEPQVLLGAQKTILRDRPPMLIEYNRNSRQEINRVLRLFNYRAWECNEPIYVKSNFNHNDNNIYPNIYSMNIFLSVDQIPGVTDTMRELSSGELAWHGHNN